MRRLFHSALLLSVLLVACVEEKPESSPPPIRRDSVQARQNEFASIDQSPMDMSYFPVNYPLKKMSGKLNEPLVARVIYSRPHKKSRQIFGNSSTSLCPYGKPWRLGANEATEIEFFTDVYIKSDKVPRGRYVMYCVPFEDKWVLALNSSLYTWGLHIDSTKDVLRTEIPVNRVDQMLEDFTMVFLPSPGGTDLVIAWDNVKVQLPVSLSQ